MNKKELYEVIKAKLSISDKELDEIYDILRKQMEERGKTKEEDILNRMNVYLLPAFTSNATKHIGIYLGIDDNFTFNQKTDAVKLDSIKKYQENQREAEDMGYVKVTEVEGQKKVTPIWHNVDGIAVQDFQLGRPIVAEDYSSTGYVFVEKEDKKFELKSLNLRGSRRDFVMKNNKSLQFKQVQFSAIDKVDKPMNDSKYLNMQVVEEKEVDLLSLLVKYAKNRCINLRDMMKFYQENVDKFIKTKSGYMSKEPIFIRGTTGEAFISEIRDNNSVEVRDMGYEKQFSIFLPKDLELPNPGTNNVVFGGRLRFDESKKDRPFGMNGFMCYVPPQSRGLIKPQIINKYVVTEEVVEDTIPQQQLLEIETKKEVEEKEDW